MLRHLASGSVLTRLLLTVVAATMGLGVHIAPAGAQLTDSGATATTSTLPGGERSGSAIVATLTVGTPPMPLEGVVMVVSKDGKEVGRSTSDDNGVVRVAVPSSSQYDVSLESSTLPEGVKFAQGARRQLRPLTRNSGDSPVVFRLVGAGGNVDLTPSFLNRLANLLASGLRFGLVIAVASVGLSIIFGTTKLTNFAHGEMVTFGAVVTWYFNAHPGGLGIQLFAAAFLGVLVSALFGGALELGLFRPLRRRGMPALTTMVVSIGLAFFLRYLIEVVFGANPRQFAQFAAQSPSIHLGPIDLRPKDVVITVVAALVLIAVGLFLQRSRLGTAIRAVSDNHDLAGASGIDVPRVILAVWIISGGLAGFGGVMLAATDTVTWNMGQRVLLIMFAAVVLGGLGTTFGAMAGGLIVGIVSDVSTLWLDSDLKIVVALGTLVLVLLFRPQGVFGVKERTA